MPHGPRGVETPEVSRQKKRAAGISVAFNITATLFKLVAAIVTGSVSLLSEAVHSFTDLAASLVAYVSVRVSAAPPDEEHPFGHGKVESLTGFGEALMIFVIVIYIVIEAVQRLLGHSGLQERTLIFGLGVMGASAVGSLAVSTYMLRTANATASTALTTNAQHLRVDFVTSAGVFAGLLVTRLTASNLTDPIIAILLALWMAYGASRLCVRAFHELIDVRLPASEIQEICDTLNKEPRVISFHRLRTRRSGSVRNVDLHIVVPREWNVVQAHALADELEKKIRESLSPADVVIHVDPFDPDKAVERERLEERRK
jgi:cation diffusion facilitator family transporter